MHRRGPRRGAAGTGGQRFVAFQSVPAVRRRSPKVGRQGGESAQDRARHSPAPTMRPLRTRSPRVDRRGARFVAFRCPPFAGAAQMGRQGGESAGTAHRHSPAPTMRPLRTRSPARGPAWRPVCGLSVGARRSPAQPEGGATGGRIRAGPRTPQPGADDASPPDPEPARGPAWRPVPWPFSRCPPFAGAARRWGDRGANPRRTAHATARRRRCVPSGPGAPRVDRRGARFVAFQSVPAVRRRSPKAGREGREPGQDRARHSPGADDASPPEPLTTAPPARAVPSRVPCGPAQTRTADPARRPPRTDRTPRG